MEIYTSNFYNFANLPKDAIAISIARWSPKWWTGNECKTLAPPPALLAMYKSNHDEEAYTGWFNAILENAPFHIYKELFTVLSERGKRPIFLLCYERPGEFCHRNLVAEWLTNNGLRCSEWTTKK